MLNGWLPVDTSTVASRFAKLPPVASVASGAAVATAFSPEEDCTTFAVDAAERQILVNTYALTIGSGPLRRSSEPNSEASTSS